MRAGRHTLWRRVLIASVTAVLCAASVAFQAQKQTAHAAYATGPYTAGAQGYDISWPQCGGMYPSTPYAFGIVGVTDGRSFTLNPCLVSEYLWAQSATAPSQLSLYMNLNYPAGTTASEGKSGPYGICKKGSACSAENYGWNAAQYAFTQNNAKIPLSASTWWLDIETGNSWSHNTALNADVIIGAIAYLQAQAVTVGVYSTPDQWQTIAGSYAPTVPNWVAGASVSSPSDLCASSLYTGGSVWLTQYVSGNYDEDYSC